MFGVGATCLFPKYQVASRTADYETMELDTISPANQIFELENRLQETRLKLRDLATMGALITSILDIETILSVVMEMAIRTVEGEVGLIQLNVDGELVTKINWGVDDTLTKNIIYRDGEDVAGYCFRRQAGIVSDTFEKVPEYGAMINSIVALPIKARARCHGVIIIINKTTGQVFGEEDKENLEILVNYAAVAIENSLLLKESLERQKIQQELVVARQVQETILPDSEIKIAGINLGMTYCPAREVGGDYYDILKMSDSEFFVVIGDVSNKGIPAAMVMSATAAIIRSQVTWSPEINPSLLMGSLNDILCDRVIKNRDMFVTLFIAHFDLGRNKITYCNAGHLPPLFWDADKREIRELRLGGTFVGQFPGISYAEGVEDIKPGDALFAFTDGLTEAADNRNNLFGLSRVKEVFLTEKGLPPGRFCERVKEWVDRFREGADADTFDDFTLLEIKIIPERA
ncbi:putative Phosphoserine phosphatase [Candidatus Zixiibacteriota bacterium]|nr:putative Phosphoserine phosphatase [candidate division Zixibacteria bacterium]